MARHRKDLGERNYARVEMTKPGYLILAPDSPWIACTVVNVSDSGICVNVGSLTVPDIFGVAFTASGGVLRVCCLVWRRGQQVGARFLSAKELRNGLASSAEADRTFPVLVD